jgi:Uma2 family endonuclease
MTYSNGSLEIMTLSLEHEGIKKLIARMLELLMFELNMEVKCGGATTFKREVIDSGLEADECYWIAHAETMRNKSTFDPEADPPPDLAIEIEVSRGTKARLPIYAALGVPEVWCYDGIRLRVLRLDSKGSYRPSPTSGALPMASPEELSRFLAMRDTLSEQQLLRLFIDWVRERQAQEAEARKPRGKKKR